MAEFHASYERIVWAGTTAMLMFGMGATLRAEDFVDLIRRPEALVVGFGASRASVRVRRDRRAVAPVAPAARGGRSTERCVSAGAAGARDRI